MRAKDSLLFLYFLISFSFLLKWVKIISTFLISFSIQREMKYKRLEMFASLICLSVTLNIYTTLRLFHCSSVSLTSDVNTLSCRSKISEPMSTIERSRKALETLKSLLNSTLSSDAQPWIWFPTDQYPSVPYQPTFSSQERIPRPIGNPSIVPPSVNHEIDRVCQRLITANTTHGEIWCKLFRKCYADTLATTTTLLDDRTTYVITGDIDLMWLRDSR